MTDKSNYDVTSVLWNMFLGYNVIMHFPVMILNFFVIIKELSLEFFGFFDPEHTNAINLFDFMGIIEDAWMFTNPINYLGLIRPWIKELGYDWVYEVLETPLKYIFPGEDGEEPSDLEIFKWVGNISKIF